MKPLILDYFTVEDIAVRWSEQTQREYSKERVFQHGLNGSLIFTIRDDVSWMSKKEHFSYFGMFSLDDDYMKHIQPFGEVQINKEQLKQVLESKSILQMYELFKVSDGDSLFYSTRYPLSVKSLYVSKDDLFSFEKSKIDFYGENQNSTDQLSWRDLFINPPQIHSDLFNYVCQSVNDFVTLNKKLPQNHNELFTYLKQCHGYDSTKRELKLPSGKMDLTNFRTNYNRWTGKT
jgi:hypothetical protein